MITIPVWFFLLLVLGVAVGLGSIANRWMDKNETKNTAAE